MYKYLFVSFSVFTSPFNYRNQLLHWFLSESMLLMCLQGQPELTKGN